MRTEPVIAIDATDGVGPTRLRLLTAGSAKLPVVVIAQVAGGPVYHVFDVASLQAELTNQLSATPLGESLDLAAREPRPAVPKSAVPTAEPGSPVVDAGRLIGVVAADKAEHPEPTEQDFARAGDGDSGTQPAKKSGLWKRLSRSDG